MKLVKEILYEKFTDTNDPMQDMGIGFVNKIFNLSLEFYSYVSGYYSEKEWKKIIAFMLKEYEPWEVLACLDNKMMRYAYENADKKHATLKDFQKYNSKYEIEREETEMDRILGNYRVQHTKWIDEYKDMAKEAGIYTESVYEKFTEHSDPVKDLRIGAIEVFYYFYISEWAEDVLINFNNPNDVKLLDWLKFNKAVNAWSSKQRYEFNKLARKAGLERKYESDGKLHYPSFTKQGGPDIMLRVSDTDDWFHLFDKDVYQEWVWNWNDISSDPGPKYKLLKDINRKAIQENLDEKFHETGDPIKDMGIGVDKRIYSIEYSWTRNWDNEQFDRTFIGTKEQIKDFIKIYSKNDKYRIYGTVASAKLVKKNLHEKFSKESDPISDLKIGTMRAIADYAKEKVATGDSSWTSMIGWEWEINNDLNLDRQTKTEWIDFLRKHKLIHQKEQKNIRLKKMNRLATAKKTWFKPITEKFEEDTDPIKDMRIGMSSKWKKFAEKIGRENHDEFNRKYFGKYDTFKPQGNVVWATLEIAGEGIDIQKAFELACNSHWFIGRKYKKHRREIANVLKKYYFANVNPDFETVNEKFEEDTDPIHDMGIGIYTKHDFKSGQSALDFMWEILPYLYGGKIPKGIINTEGSGFFSKEYGRTINDYYWKYLYVNGKNVITENDPNRGMDMWKFNNALHNALIRAGYPLSGEAIQMKRYETMEYRDNSELRIKNKANESYIGFTENGDPIQDMGIGAEARMKEKLDKMDIMALINVFDEIPDIRKKYRDEEAECDSMYYRDIPLDELEQYGIKKYMLDNIDMNTNGYDGSMIIDDKNNTVTLGGGD